MYDKVAIAKRYSEALFMLANQHNVLDKIQYDLTLSKNEITKDTQLSKLLFNHCTPVALKKSLVYMLEKKSNFHNLTKKFFSVLVQNNRFHVLNEVLTNFNKQVSDVKNEISVDVKSSHKLSNTTLKNLKDKLQKYTNKNIKLNLSIEEKLMGGIIIKIGYKMLDCSFYNKFHQIMNIDNII